MEFIFTANVLQKVIVALMFVVLNRNVCSKTFSKKKHKISNSN